MSESVRIEKLVYGGDGLARPGGQVLLAPLVLPGELVEVERTGKVHARLLRVDEAAPERIAPGCPYFGTCGGCHYQHAPYQYQTQQKVAILREVLQRIAKIDPPSDIAVITGPEWQYRNRIQLHIENGEVGYRRLGSHALCAIDHCPISSPKLNECIGILRSMVKERRFPSFIETVELFTNEKDVQINVVETLRPVARHFFDWCAERIPGFVPGEIYYDRFRVSGKSFFQVNRFLADALVQAAVGLASGDSAVDLYAGVGLFSIPLKNQFQQLTAVESGHAAVSDLKFNAQRAGADIQVVKASVNDYLAQLQTAPDLILADPPRAGLEKAAVSHLMRLRPQRLHIVACDPATLARDIQPLLATGYHIEQLALIDLFPQTYHLETIVHLTR